MSNDYLSRTEHQNILNAAVSSTGTNSANIDTAKLDGILSLLIHARASGTNTATITIQHSHDASAWATLDSAAVIDKDTGEASAFGSISTTEYEEQRGIDLTKTRRYVRVNIAGTSLSHNISIGYAAVQIRSDSTP